MSDSSNFKGYSIRDFQFWRIVGSLGLASMFIFGSMYSVQPILPMFTKEFDVKVSYSSMMMSLTTVGLIIGLIVLGFFSDRIGRTNFVRFSIIGSVIPFFLMTLSDNFVWIIILRFIQGFLLAGVPAAALAYISEEIDRKFLSVATALYISCNALGGMIGRVVTGYATEHFSWEIAFYILAVSGIFVFILVLVTLPNSRNFQPQEASFRDDLDGFAYHFKNPSLMLMFGLGIVLQLSFTGIWTYIPFHLTDSPFSLSIDAVSNIFFAYGLGVIGSPLASWMAGKIGQRKVLISGVFMLSLGILLTNSSSVWMIVVGLCVVCLGFFTAHSLAASSVSRDASHHKGSASSLYLVSYYIGVGVGSTLLGPLWERLGWSGLVTFTAVVPVIYVVFVMLIQYWNTKKQPLV
ncbi:MFS transporter [Psychrobacillus sp. BL-248-WT-3]|uniref:MFS transporter n=1 Tax=Psychrobacillus sp. BL-248-WT-3 TaxID=2725306 RepID=UPI001F0EB219|nr:MFS transporter [Psychrobacillus sp. BL-248-WT-3]